MHRHNPDYNKNRTAEPQVELESQFILRLPEVIIYFSLLFMSVNVANIRQI